MVDYLTLGGVETKELLKGDPVTRCTSLADLSRELDSRQDGADVVVLMNPTYVAREGAGPGQVNQADVLSLLAGLVGEKRAYDTCAYIERVA